MADENLILTITARNQTEAAFNDVKKGLQGVNEQVAKVAPEVEKTNAQTAAAFRNMAGHADNFGRNVLQGDVIGAIRSFSGMAITAFRTMGIELALATAGISLIIGAIAVAISRSKDLAKEQEELWKATNEQIKDAHNLSVSAMADGAAKEKAILAGKFAEQNALQKANFEQQKARIDKQLEDERISVQNHDNILYLLADGFRTTNKTRQETYNSELLKIDQKYQEQRQKQAAEAFEKWVADSNRKWLFDNAGQVNADAREVEQQQKHAKEFADKVKKAQEEVARIRKDIQNADYAEQLKAREDFDRKMVEYNKRMASEMVAFSMNIGTALSVGIGKGSEGMKESMREVLNVVLSFAEKLVVANIAAALATNWWNPAVWGQIATVTLAFESAKIAIQSFQTPTGAFRTIPGAPNVEVPIIAHGGEKIGRGGGSEQLQITVVANDDLSRAISKSLYFHSKRTGQQIDFNSVRG